MATGSVQGARAHANPAANPTARPANEAGPSQPTRAQQQPQRAQLPGGLAPLPARAAAAGGDSSAIASSSNALSAAVYAEGAAGGPVGEARRRPAAAAPRTTAADLKTAMNGAKADGATPADQQAGFQALAQYAAQPNRRDHALARLNEVAQGAATAAITFGGGRPAGNWAVDAAGPNLPQDPGYVDAGAHAVGSAIGGTVMNMLAQAFVPGAGDALFRHKMAPVPAEALVPQRTDEHGAPIPLSPAETALRKEITERQKAIGDPGSMANTMAGAAAFTGAQIVRLGAELGKTEGGAAGAAEEGATPSKRQKAMQMGFSAAVSATGGALLSAAVVAQKHNAKISVPNPNGGAPVDMPLFVPTKPQAGVAPPWRGNVSQVVGSALMRVMNLAIAGTPIQAGLAAMQRIQRPDVGALAAVAGQLTGVAAYFAGLGRLARIEGPRPHGPAQPAAAEAVAPAGGAPGGAGPVAVAMPAGGGAAGAAVPAGGGAAGAAPGAVELGAAGAAGAAADSGLTAESRLASAGSEPESPRGDDRV
jgi:hypothetical protein